MPAFLIDLWKQHLAPFWDSVFVWRTIALVLSSAGVIAYIARKRWIHLLQDRIPHRAVRIVRQGDDQFWWQEGTQQGKPVMLVTGKWYVTNVTNMPVCMVRAQMGVSAQDYHVLTRHPSQNMYGSYPILPGAMSEVMVDFTVMPPVRKVGKDLKTVVILVDQYGNEYRTPKATFRSHRRKK